MSQRECECYVQIFGAVHEDTKTAIERCDFCREREQLLRDAVELLGRYTRGVLMSDRLLADIYDPSLALLRKAKALGIGGGEYV